MATSILLAQEEGNLSELEYQALYNHLRAESMPKHVTILFMDDASHEVLKDIVRICCELGIKVLSICTLSSENFHQQKEEVVVPMNIIKWNLEDLARNDIKVSIIGNRSLISDSLLEVIREVEESTKNNKSLHIIEAINYTGQNDIMHACTTLVEKVIHGMIQPEDIDEIVFEQELDTKCSEFPNPDLMIRSGKYSIDNFMLWQMAYSELYFVDKDDTGFTKTNFIEALDEYQNRSRRFGAK